MHGRLTISGRKFAALRRARYWTQEEFAQHIGMSAQNVRRLEQSEVGGMQVKNFRRLADLLKVTPDELRQRIGASAEAELDPAGPVAGRSRGIAEAPTAIVPGSVSPVVEIERFHGVSAARPEDRTDLADGKSLAPAGAMRRFSAVVDGDCMEPKYRHGEVVIFSVDAAELEGVINGRNYFVQFDDGQNTFKRLFADPADPELLVLRCWNQRYPERAVPRSSVKLIARAIYKLVPDPWDA